MDIKLEYSITCEEFLELVEAVEWKSYSKDVKDGEKMQIELTPTAGKERFYEKAGFKYNPDKITGMYLWIKK